MCVRACMCAACMCVCVCVCVCLVCCVWLLCCLLACSVMQRCFCIVISIKFYYSVCVCACVRACVCMRACVHVCVCVCVCVCVTMKIKYQMSTKLTRQAITTKKKAILVTTDASSTMKSHISVWYPYSYFWLETGSCELVFVLSRASKQKLLLMLKFKGLKAKINLHAVLI